jgi:hypothetical protein
MLQISIQSEAGVKIKAQSVVHVHDKNKPLFSQGFASLGKGITVYRTEVWTEIGFMVL